MGLHNSLLSLTLLCISSSGSNDFSFGNNTPNNEEAHFWSRTSLNGSALLPLQEWACDEVGISFN